MSQSASDTTKTYPERRDHRTLRLLAELISGLQVPYSVAMQMTKGHPESMFGVAAEPLVRLWQELHTIGYPPAEEIEKLLRRALEVPVPEGWERCGSTCPDSGKWGASVDPKKYELWTRRHRQHWAAVGHFYTIHEVEPIPDHDQTMVHSIDPKVPFSMDHAAYGCPSNCPRRQAVERYRREER